MHFVYFKFRSTIEYEKLAIESRVINVGDFKKLIAEHKSIGKNADSKIEVKNATTDQNYTDDSELIHENSTLVLRRVPAYLSTAVVTQMKTIDVVTGQSSNNNNNNNTTRQQLQPHNSMTNNNEEEKMKVIMNQNQSVIDYEHKQSDSLHNTKKTGKVPVCYHCKAVGHVYRTCPLLTHQSQVMRDEPTHIFLKSQLGLLPSSQSSMNTNNTNGVAAANTSAIGLNSRKNIPDYLICPLCEDLMENAVLSACCGTSFCDSCVQDYLLKNDFKCFACEAVCHPDTIVANISLRKSIFTFTGADIPPTSAAKSSHSTTTPSTASSAILQQQQPSSSNVLVDSNTNINNNTFAQQPVIQSLATHMLHSLLTPLLTSILPRNSAKKQWNNNNPMKPTTNQRVDYNNTHHGSSSAKPHETLKRRTELFKKLEMLTTTQKVLSREQFDAMKDCTIRRKHVFRNILSTKKSTTTNDVDGDRSPKIEPSSSSREPAKSKNRYDSDKYSSRHYHDDRYSRSNSHSKKHSPSSHRSSYHHHSSYKERDSRSNDRKRKYERPSTSRSDRRER